MTHFVEKARNKSGDIPALAAWNSFKAFFAKLIASEPLSASRLLVQVSFWLAMQMAINVVDNVENKR